MDGTDISGITRASLRQSYAMVLQDTWLFREAFMKIWLMGALAAWSRSHRGKVRKRLLLRELTVYTQASSGL
ncbi:MAG: hypothetical protein ACLVLH_21860 [Eisenbergiella massiliensis]